MLVHVKVCDQLHIVRESDMEVSVKLGSDISMYFKLLSAKFDIFKRSSLQEEGSSVSISTPRRMASPMKRAITIKPKIKVSIHYFVGNPL